jgi:hypothetical protein
MPTRLVFALLLLSVLSAVAAPCSQGSHYRPPQDNPRLVESLRHTLDFLGLPAPHFPCSSSSEVLLLPLTRWIQIMKGLQVCCCTQPMPRDGQSQAGPRTLCPRVFYQSREKKQNSAGLQLWFPVNTRLQVSLVVV